MKRQIIWLPLFAAMAALAGASCSHEIQSPTPKENGVEPDLVCNAKPVSQPVSKVTIHGENFTPMPSKTLESKPELILPTITLTETSPIGTPVTKPIVYGSKPGDPLASAVHWTTEGEMSFEVRPEDMIASGVFTVTVTNPDGKSAATLPKALAIIPPPTLTTIKPPAICDDQSDQTVEVDGQNFLVHDTEMPTVTVGPPCKADSDCPSGITCDTAIDTCQEHTYPATVDPKSCTPLDGNFTEKNVELCTSVTFTIPKGDFPVTSPTKLNVAMTNPAPADCESSATVQLTINPPPEVDAVVPSTVCAGGSQLTVSGKNFEMGATVSIGCGTGAPVNASSNTVNSDGTQVSATFGAGAVPGNTCDVIVTNPDGCQDRPLPHKQVMVVDGPIVFYADPPVVYNGINTRITIFATTITPPLKSVTIVPTGTTTQVTNLTYTYPVPGNHPNRVQAIVPANQAPGSYDLTITDSSGCFATLPGAITVTKDLTVTVKSVVPPFGDTAQDTAVTIFRDTAAPAPMDKPFVVTPRVFLNPSNPMPTDVAIEMTGVSFVDANTATGLVPKGTPVHQYDVVLVNPDGSVGLLANGYQEVASPPPVVVSATPSSIVDASGQTVTLAGTDFAMGDMITLRCASGANPMVTSTAPVCNGSSCTQSITIDGSALPAGDVCVVRVTNPDGTYGEYSAIGVTNASLNLSAPQKGTDMNVGRRALSAASGNATSAARFVYAIGGDDGTVSATGALDSTEFAPVDVFGKFGTWQVQEYTLKAKRTLAGAATVGRYIYVVGGDDGNGPVDTAERALILSPSEAPVINDVDLVLNKSCMADGDCTKGSGGTTCNMTTHTCGGGLDAGEWHYRVSAFFSATDSDNPNGESLASDEFSIKLPAIGSDKITITPVWQAPVDSLGMPLPNVAGYNIYRTVKAGDAPGTEVLIGTVMGGSTLTFTDDGSATPGTQAPLPTGSTGQWAQLPNLGAKRSGPAVIAGFDPVTPGKFYVYALLGKSAATTANTSYEYLPVTIAPNGRQTASAAWTTGTSPSVQGRWQLGAWAVDKTVISGYAPDTWIFLGGGLDGSGAGTGKVEAGKIAAGGDLGVLSDTPKDFSSNSAGYGVCGANGQLFVFGGQGAAPFSGAKSASLQTPAPTLANNSWNSEGLTMTHGRYLMGSAVQSSFIFLLGGQTDEPSAASKTTELVIW